MWEILFHFAIFSYPFIVKHFCTPLQGLCHVTYRWQINTEFEIQQIIFCYIFFFTWPHFLFPPNTDVLPQAKDILPFRIIQSSVQGLLCISFPFQIFSLSQMSMQVYSGKRASFVLSLFISLLSFCLLLFVFLVKSWKQE